MAVQFVGAGIAGKKLALAAGTFVAGAIYGWLRGEPPPESVFESTRRLAQTRRLSEAGAITVIGNARLGGTVLYELDRQWPIAGGADGATDDQQTRYIYLARLLSEGVIDGVHGLWIDDVEVPLVAEPGSTRGRFSQASAFDVQRAALIARQKALIPNSRLDNGACEPGGPGYG